MSDRSFNFPVSILTRSAQKLKGALLDPVGAPVAARLPAGFADSFGTTINQVVTGATGQSATSGHTGELTQAQNAALAEVKRFSSGARKTAKLAFPGNEVLLHQAFQVGNSDPVGLADIVERATLVQASCVQYADALAQHGWIAEDTAAFAAAIAAVAGADDVQEAAKGDKKASTTAKNTQANRLYALCQSLQNAADRAYPAHKAENDEAIVAARARFLLDTFPPAPGASAEEETNPQTPSTPTTTN